MGNFINQNYSFSIFLSLILIGFGLHFTFANSTSSYNNTVDKIELSITLGRGPSCTGRGICKLKLASSKNQIIDANGKIYFNKANKLMLDIYKDHIADSTKTEQIVDNQFELIDKYTIPEEIMMLLGISNPHTIEIGKYQVIETDECYNIEF